MRAIRSSWATQVHMAREEVHGPFFTSLTLDYADFGVGSSKCWVNTPSAIQICKKDRFRHFYADDTRDCEALCLFVSSDHIRIRSLSPARQKWKRIKTARLWGSWLALGAVGGGWCIASSTHLLITHDEFRWRNGEKKINFTFTATGRRLLSPLKSSS